MEPVPLPDECLVLCGVAQKPSEASGNVFTRIQQKSISLSDMSERAVQTVCWKLGTHFQNGLSSY